MKNGWMSSGTGRHDTTGRSEAGGRGLWVTPCTFWACEGVPKWGGVASRPKSQPWVRPDVTSTITPGAPCPAPPPGVPQAQLPPQVCLCHSIQSLLRVTLQVRLECHLPPIPPSLQLDDGQGLGLGARVPSTKDSAWSGGGRGGRLPREAALGPGGALPTSSPSVLVSPDPELGLRSLP